MGRILLINQGQTENLGDKAIRMTFQKLLESRGYSVDSVGFSPTKEQFIDQISLDTKYKIKHKIKQYIKYLVHPVFIWFFRCRKGIKKEFELLKHRGYDLVIIGGGQLIQSKNVFTYILLSWFNLVKKKIGCPIIIAGVGAENEYTKMERLIYKRSLQQINEIYVRDSFSQKILKEQFGITSKYIPDIAFAYLRFTSPVAVKQQKNRLLVMVYDYTTLKKKFGTQHNSVSSYFGSWKDLIQENFEEGMELILAYTTIEDKKATYEFSKYLKEKTEIKFSICETNRIKDFVDVLLSTKILITGRMHAMLLGLLYKCQVVPYVVSPKIAAFKSEWLDKEFDINYVNSSIDESITDLLNNVSS